MLSSKEIVSEVERREKFLEQLVRGELIEPVLGENKQLKFLIARRWNSWYPSYFSTLGGCYVIQTRDNEHCGNKKDKNSGCIVVDPGFGFLNELRKKYKIEPHEIRSIIVSHFHPDHMAGIIEFLTLTHESKHPCNIYLNKTSFEYFKSFQGKYNRIYQLNGGQSVELAKYKFKGKKYKTGPGIDESIYVRALKVHHAEIGNTHQSLGLIFTIKTGKKEWELGILGDTDGSDRYMKEYVENLRGVDVLVLHLGTYSDTNYGQGDKHLYRLGINKLLHEISKDDNLKNNIKSIILSEFGLEMAEVNELRRLCGDFINSHGFFNMIAFYNLLSSEKLGEKHEFHKSMFSKFSNDIIISFLYPNSNQIYNNYDNLYASLLCLLIVLDKNNFKNKRNYIKIDIKRILSSNLKIQDFLMWDIEIDPDYAKNIEEEVKDYINEMIKFWETDVDISLDLIKELVAKIFNDLKNKDFYQLSNSGIIRDFEILHYTKKYLKSIKKADNNEKDDDSLKEILEKIEELSLSEIIFEILYLIGVIYTVSDELKSEDETNHMNLHKGLKIMPSVLTAFKDELNAELNSRLFLSHNGLELAFSDSISIKGKDNADNDLFIPIEAAFQDPDNSMSIRLKPAISDLDRWMLSVPAPNEVTNTDFLALFNIARKPIDLI